MNRSAQPLPSGARPRSNVRALVHDPPLMRKSSAYEVSQSTAGRGKISVRFYHIWLSPDGSAVAVDDFDDSVTIIRTKNGKPL